MFEKEWLYGYCGKVKIGRLGDWGIGRFGDWAMFDLIENFVVSTGLASLIIITSTSDP
jgi:hypothetical protein